MFNFQEFRRTNKRFNKETYAYGIAHEKVLLPLLRLYFDDDTIIRTPEDKYIELKSRTCRKNMYPDTAIGLPKIKQARNDYTTTQYYFVFNFTDGTYVWKYDPKVILREGMIKAGTAEFFVKHYFIPTSLLQPLVPKTVRFAEEISIKII